MLPMTTIRVMRHGFRGECLGRLPRLLSGFIELNSFDLHYLLVFRCCLGLSLVGQVHSRESVLRVLRMEEVILLETWLLGCD